MSIIDARGRNLRSSHEKRVARKLSGMKVQQSTVNTGDFTRILLVWEPDGVFAYGERSGAASWEYFFSDADQAKAFCSDEWGTPADSWTPDLSSN